VHIYVLGPKLLRWNFLQNSASYTKWCAQTFPPIFGLFAIFDRNFAKIVAPPCDRNKNCLALLKTRVKTESNSTHKQRHNSCSNYIALERTARRTSLTCQKTNTTFSHLQPARVVRSESLKYSEKFKHESGMHHFFNLQQDLKPQDSRVQTLDQVNADRQTD